jgi:hypothetical protein
MKKWELYTDSNKFYPKLAARSSNDK